MRIGSALVFLVFSWIGLGYLLSDNINTHRALAQVQQQVDQAVKERKAIQDQLGKASSEIATLKQQNSQLAEQVALLQGQVNQLQNQNRELKNQNTQLQGQIEHMKKFSQLVEDLTNVPSPTLLLAVFLPVFPVSLAAGFIIYRYNRHHNNWNPAQYDKPKRTMSIQITEEETQQIIKMRRGH